MASFCEDTPDIFLKIEYFSLSLCKKLNFYPLFSLFVFIYLYSAELGQKHKNGDFSKQLKPCQKARFQ